MPLSLRRWYVAGLAAAVGCAPHVQSFTLTPSILCSDQRGIARWSAKGDVAMTVEFESPTVVGYPCAARGESIVKLTAVASRCDREDTKWVEVVGIGPDAAEPVVLRTSTVAGNDVVAQGQKDPETWDSSVEIATIASCANRTIQATHAGKTVALPADGSSSSEFAGLPIGGDWELRTPMSPVERANPAQRPKKLAVLATIHCKAGTP